MSPLTFWIGRASAWLLLFALGLLAGWLWHPGSALRRSLSGYERKLGMHLTFVRAPVRPRVLLAAQSIGASGGLLLAAAFEAWLLASLLVAASLLPPVVLAHRAATRTRKIGDQVEGWLTALASALRATPSLGDALRSTASLLQDPISSELSLLCRENQLGLPLDRALSEMAERIGSSTFKMAVSILNTARRSGGNLPETLCTAAGSLREMARLEGVVRTKTAEGKAQAFVIGAMPFPMYFGIRWLSPDYFVALETTTTGHLLFAAAALLWLGSILTARRILRVDI